MKKTIRLNQILIGLKRKNGHIQNKKSIRRQFKITLSDKTIVAKGQNIMDQLDNNIRHCPSCNESGIVNEIKVPVSYFTGSNPTYDESVLKEFTTNLSNKTILAKCSNCSLIYSRYSLNPDQYNLLYEKLIDPCLSLQKSFVDNYQEVFNSYFKKIRVLIKNNARVLDYGCGWGEFLNNCIKNGVTNIFGFEYSQSRRKILHSNGIPICSDIDELKKNAPYDFIMCNQFLEHDLDFNDTLELFLNILSDDGYIWISVPNTKNIFNYSKNGEFSLKSIPDREVNPWEHVNYFTPDTLSKILTAKGFDLLDINTLDHVKKLGSTSCLIQKRGKRESCLTQKQYERKKILKQDLTPVIQSSGERSEEVSERLLKQQVDFDLFTITKEDFFPENVKKIVEIADKTKARYLLVIDANVLLFPDALEYIMYEAEKQKYESFFRIDFPVYDKFSGRANAGVSLYNTSYLNKFMTFLDSHLSNETFSDNINQFSETNEIKYITSLHFIVGKRNYFQSYKDLMNNLIQSESNENIDQLISVIERKRSENIDDWDFLVISEILNHIQNDIDIDLDGILKRHHIPEKEPLDTNFSAVIIESLSQNMIMKKRLANQ